jgi:acyl carrier protein
VQIYQHTKPKINTEKGEQKYVVADQLGIDEDDIKLESNFKEDLEADSLDLFELVMALEEEYGVEIPSEDLEKIATVNDIIEYLKNKGVEA